MMLVYCNLPELEFELNSLLPLVEEWD